MGVSALNIGSDTANTALTATFYFLARHPEVLERLTEKVRRTFNSVESITTGTQMLSLTYLRACIDESMRLCPPIPMILPRKVSRAVFRSAKSSFPKARSWVCHCTPYIIARSISTSRLDIIHRGG